jgi:hypothetical protein
MHVSYGAVVVQMSPVMATAASIKIVHSGRDTFIAAAVA